MSRTPPIMAYIVDYQNKFVLTRSTDLKLAKNIVWQLVFCRQFGNQCRATIGTQSMSHQAIYIQKRHLSESEISYGRQRRKNAICRQMIGQDYANISCVTTIVQTHSNCIIYASPDLHINHHGSVSVEDLDMRNIILDVAGIPHYELKITDANRSGIASNGDVSVAFHLSKTM